MEMVEERALNQCVMTGEAFFELRQDVKRDSTHPRATEEVSQRLREVGEARGSLEEGLVKPENALKPASV